jgi:hypothetical protein
MNNTYFDSISIEDDFWFGSDHPDHSIDPYLKLSQEPQTHLIGNSVYLAVRDDRVPRRLSGFEASVADIRVRKVKLKGWTRLTIAGIAGKDDFGIGKDGKIVLSLRASLSLLDGADNCSSITWRKN